MSSIAKYATLAALLFGVTACGDTWGQRAVTGGGIGAGSGALLGVATGFNPAHRHSGFGKFAGHAAGFHQRSAHSHWRAKEIWDSAEFSAAGGFVRRASTHGNKVYSCRQRDFARLEDPSDTAIPLTGSIQYRPPNRHDVAGHAAHRPGFGRVSRPQKVDLDIRCFSSRLFS